MSPTRRFTVCLRSVVIGLLSAVAVSSHALTAEQVRAMAVGDSDERAAAIAQAAASGDPQAPAFFQALLDDAVKVAGERVFVVRDSKAVDAASGAAAHVPPDAEDVVNSNRIRRALDAALASLKLLSPDRALRAAAIRELREQADDARLPLIEKAYAAETDVQLKGELDRLRSTVLVSSAAMCLRNVVMGATPRT